MTEHQARTRKGLDAARTGPRRFGRLYGGWSAVSYVSSSAYPINQCAGRPNRYYFIADSSLTVTRIGAAYSRDGVVPSNLPGAVWLAAYPRAIARLTGSSTAQLVSTTGRPLGPRYRLPAGYLLGSGVGSYLLLVNNEDQNLSVLWVPATGPRAPPLRQRHRSRPGADRLELGPAGEQ